MPKKDYVDFSYSKITPNNLIGIEEYNNDFFKKLDEIENKISNNFNFDQLIHEYNLEKISKINFIPLNKDENIENKIYELRNDSSLRLIDQNDFFLLLKIDKINSITPKINDKDFAETVRQMLFQKNKYEYNKNLLKNINKKKFNDNDFEKLANNDKNKILNSTFNSIKDNSKFNIDSVKLIYSLPINSFVLIADDKENIYLAKILKENFTNLGKNNKIIDIYTAQTGSNIKNKM